MTAYFEKITEPLLIQSYEVLFLISFALCCVIILSARYGFSRRSDIDAAAIQSAHSGFVPRVGGLAIYLSILGFIPLSMFGFIPISLVLDLKIGEISWIIISASPVFLVGLAEDLGYPMKPSRRLLASIASSMLVVIIFKVWISELGVPGLDSIISVVPLGIAFTLFATAGVVNAFNLIDGLNGLSCYVSISTAVALSVVAFEVGNTQILIILLLLSASILGFMILNFPLGKIFLGDAGAYTLGHLLVWSSIMLINFDTDISPFAILLIFFWPVADTGLAIWRRWKQGKPTARPDRLHFHQLVMRYLEIRVLGRGRRHLTNPLATVVLAPLISVPQILGVIFWNEFNLTVFATLAMALIFVATYIYGIDRAKKTRLSGIDI